MRLKITDLDVHFGTRRVVHLGELALGQAEIVGLAGESGSGKSMTTLAILGLAHTVGATVSGSIQLDGAELLPLGRRRLRVEWTPGHSPGHICLYDPKEKLLFAGDTLLPDVSPNIGLHPQSTPDPLHEYLDGLRRLAAYDPDLILPAHGRPFTGAQARVKVLESHHQRRLDQIVEIVGNGKETGWEVALELWGPRDHFYEKRLALQEALAHLQALAVDGRVMKFATPEIVRWTPV